MKKSQLQQIIKEELKRILNETADINESPVSIILDRLAAPEIAKSIDMLADTLPDNEFMAIKNLYVALYKELKKHDN